MTNEPSGIALFVSMFIAVLGMVGIIYLIGWLSANGGRLVRSLITSSREGQALPPPPIVATTATTATTPATPIAMQQSASNPLLLQAKAQALALLVKAGKVPQTEGIWIVFGERASSTNPRYKEIRDLLHEELARLTPAGGPQFPPLTPEQELVREKLELTTK